MKMLRLAWAFFLDILLPVAIGLLIVALLYSCKAADTVTIPWKPVANTHDASTDQSSGRDSWSFAPSLTFGDAASGLAGVSLVGLAVSWWRGRRASKAMRAMIDAIELGAQRDDRAAMVKDHVQAGMERAGLERWFHGRVKRRTDRPKR